MFVLRYISPMVRSYLQNTMKVGIDPNTPRPCKGCGKLLPVSMFSVNGNGYYTGMCKPCTAKHAKDYYDAHRGIRDDKYWLIRLRSIKQGAKRRGLSFSLKAGDLKALYERQGGLCYYTGLPMKINSIDRIDPERGYSPTNIIMCERYLNVFRGDMPRDDFIELCRTVARRHCACQDPVTVKH